MSANEQAVMAEFAESLWNNYIRQKIDELFTNNVSFYLASVTANPGSGTLTVQAPLDSERTVSCTNELRGISVGSQVAVLKLGNGNAALNHLAFLSVSNNALIKAPLSIASGGTGATTASAALANLSGVPILDNPTDLDAAMEIGLAHYNASASNKPTSAGGSLIVVPAASPYVHQLALPNHSQGVSTAYIRQYTSNGWATWTRLST